MPWIIVIGYSVSGYNGNSINIYEPVEWSAISDIGESFPDNIAAVILDIDSTIGSSVVYFGKSTE